jgi:hypothetical protein
MQTIEERNFIKIIDSPTGTGKTTWAFNYIKSLPDDKKVIFITPFLDEITRVIKDCPEKHFVQPERKYGSGRKEKHLLKLIRAEENIASTHSLFSKITDELITALHASGYILILDEVFGVVEKFDMWEDFQYMSKEEKDELTKNNLKTLFDKGFITTKDDFLVEWIDKDNPLDKYRGVKELIDRGLLYLINGTLLLWTFPVEVFQPGIFEEIYILTYQFDYQLQSYYYKYFNISYSKYHIETINNVFTIIETINNNYEIEWIEKIKPLITIIDNSKLNKIGDYISTMKGINKSVLCKNWYRNNTGEFNRIQKNIINFYTFYAKVPSTKRMWTCFLSYKRDIKCSNISLKTWVAMNYRATNKFKGKTALAYMLNRYINPFFISFFNKKNIELNQDGFALSEMIQWIWRSAIRDYKPIIIYIPSQRMRTLLEGFLNQESVAMEVISQPIDQPMEIYEDDL